MTQPADRSFTGDFRRFFIKGLAVLLPTVLTLWILVKAYEFVDGAIAEPINGGIRFVMWHATPHSGTLGSWFEPSDEAVARRLSELTRDSRFASVDRVEVVGALRTEAIQDWWNRQWFMDLIGIVVAIVSVYIAGRFLGGFLGRRIYQRVEAFFTRIPVIKQVYPSVKQIVDFLISDEKPIKFNRVVVVEYPRPGIWSIGLVTGGTMKVIEGCLGSGDDSLHSEFTDSVHGLYHHGSEGLRHRDPDLDRRSPSVHHQRRRPRALAPGGARSRRRAR